MMRSEQLKRRQTKRVLVVDDEPTIREMLADFLELNNFICLQANDGEAAVDYAKREQFDLIIMDIRMPGVSGIDALRTIKQELPEQPIVMVTAVNEVETAVEAMRLGAYDYVMKPFILRDMLVVIDKAIKGRGHRFDPMPEPDDFDAPMTIAVGTPLEEDSEELRDEVRSIAEDVTLIQDRLTDLASRLDALSHPRLKVLSSLESSGQNGGDAA